MIGFLRGKVAHVFSDYCFLDVRDVGYRVFISHATRTHLSVGEEVMLYVHTHVREDAILLYGFFSQEEYDLFSYAGGLLRFLPATRERLAVLVVESLAYLPKLREMLPAARLFAVAAEADRAEAPEEDHQYSALSSATDPGPVRVVAGDSDIPAP